MCGLAFIALVSALLAWLFVQLWTQHLAEQESRYFRDQGFGRAQAIKEELDRHLEAQLIREHFRPYREWRTIFPQVFRGLERQISSSSALAANEISLIDPRQRDLAAGFDGTVVTIGETFAPYPESGERLGSITIAVERRDGTTLVIAWGPLKAPEGSPEDLKAIGFAFRCVLRYQSPSLGDRGGTFAALLVCSYLVMLWLIVMVVYYLERRRMGLKMQGQEKSIRLNAMAQIAEGIAHEVRNPLNGISLNVQYLEKLQEKGASPSSEDYHRVYGELTKIKNVIDDFVTFSRLEDIELESFSFAEVVDDVLREMEPFSNDIGVKLDRKDRRETDFRGDRAKLSQALKAVIRNALEALAGEDGERVMKLRLDSDRSFVSCSVENGGETLEPEVLKSMFDPFYTTRSSAMGLGLTLAKTIVEAHGGTIEAVSPPGGGCCLDIWLPRRL